MSWRCLLTMGQVTCKDKRAIRPCMPQPPRTDQCCQASSESGGGGEL